MHVKRSDSEERSNSSCCLYQSTRKYQDICRKMEQNDLKKRENAKFIVTIPGSLFSKRDCLASSLSISFFFLPQDSPKDQNGKFPHNLLPPTQKLKLFSFLKCSLRDPHVSTTFQRLLNHCHLTSEFFSSRFPPKFSSKNIFQALHPLFDVSSQKNLPNHDQM